MLLDVAVVAFEGGVPSGAVAEGAGTGWGTEIADVLPVEFARAGVEATAFRVVEA